MRREESITRESLRVHAILLTMKKAAFAVPWLLCLIPSLALARGVSPYLPLNLDPEIERQIERVLILADKPVLTRPIAAATVLEALPRACEADRALCQQVRRYLDRYMHSSGLTHASIEGAASSSTDRVIPNRYGLRTTSGWQASVDAYWQWSDYALLSLGGVASKGDSNPQGSVLSLGFDRAQLDIGYRAHWLSPMTDSSMLQSTEAATLPSVTISNYTPLTRFGLHYEAFVARMAKSDNIVFQKGFTSGHPRIAGISLSMEPASGWALGVNRILQYGGGARPGSLHDLMRAFFNPSGADNNVQFGNQQASITSRFLFPGKMPFAVYFEYAGEDTSRGRNYLLGNAALSGGIHFPRLWRRFDLTYEASEWQNSWYTHSVYLDGLTNDGLVLGHWAADQRKFRDGVGSQSHMVRVGWEPSFGGNAELRLRTVANATYTLVGYERAYDATVRYSRNWRQLTIGGEVFTGRDVFRKSFAWAGAFVRYSPEATASDSAPDYEPVTTESGSELFVDAGVNANKVQIDLTDSIPRASTRLGFAPHFAVGARRSVSNRSDLGARLELDSVNGHVLMGIRILDYRYRFAGPFALSFFGGAARYDLATPAYGQYLGIGGQWRNVVPGWDVGIDLRYATKVARDHLLPSDPASARPDSFYDITSTTLYLTRRF
jgi:hypothetical protein